MLKTPQTTWFMGHKLPRNALIKQLVASHVVAVQEYDHATAALIEEFIHKYARRYEEYDKIPIMERMVKGLVTARRLLNHFAQGNVYMERGEIDRLICESQGQDYHHTSTADFEKLCKTLEDKP